ncbi:glycoside hydrolase family 28 protein [Ereboglobus luteus]|uniref:Glycoside hydrolase n=1 Tax=Ereboglobus luteus TaxID=1796921 RepID=A0A2U8E6N8_9BACT|nr:glycoside hydrolase family 28 protein [Ereboglobus luteus]AWI10234.1 hypothetical protein CKA38_14115 [Ereboglobus luteus]
MKIFRNIAIFLALATALNAADIRSLYDVRDHGAKGDGATLDTAAIQKTIDTCTAEGGGTVWFPAGTYLVGTVHIKDNVTLHLTAGATILGSPNVEDYTEVEKLYRQGLISGTKGKATYPQRHLIYARDAKNVAIEGAGAIDGNGDSYFSEDMKSVKLRPTPMLEFLNSTGVRLENITIRNAPCWTVHVKNCEDVKIRGCSIVNNLRVINSDGIGIDSSRKVMISDCRIESGDDCIVLKTTKMGDRTPPVEHVTVTNCVMISSASALKLGTESHGDFRHVYMSNCTITDSRTGIALFVKDGGTMQNIRFSNISITTKRKWDKGNEWPIIMDINRRQKSSRLGAIRDVLFSDITIYTRGRSIITGHPNSPIENLVFRNIFLSMVGDEDLTKAKKISGGASGVEVEVDYGKIPASLILANAKDPVVDGYNVRWGKGKFQQPRHVIYGDRLENARISGIFNPASSPSLDAVILERSKPAAK